MIESIIPMTTGLLLDICGAFLILKPLMFFRDSGILTKYHPFGNNSGRAALEFSKKLNDQISYDSKEKIKYADAVKWGFGFLAIGFFLILIASWIDYLK